MEAEREAYAEEHGVRKNGFYERNLLTRWGKIENLRVPRTREGDFYPSLLRPYSRTWHLEDLLIELYAGGMSYEEIRKVLNTLLEATLSPSSISRLTEIAYEDARACPSSKAERALESVLERWGKRYPSVKRTLLRFWDDLLNFYHFPLSSGYPSTPPTQLRGLFRSLGGGLDLLFFSPTRKLPRSWLILVCLRLNEGFSRRRLRRWVGWELTQRSRYGRPLGSGPADTLPWTR